MKGNFHQKFIITLLVVLAVLVGYQTWLLKKTISLNHPKISGSGWQMVQDYQQFLSEDPFSAFIWAQTSLNESRARMMLQAYQTRLLEKIAFHLQEKAVKERFADAIRENENVRLFYGMEGDGKNLHFWMEDGKRDVK